METLTLSLPEDLRARLKTIAAATNQSLEDCLLLAVREFIEHWERHLNDVHLISEEEVRAVLNAALAE